MDQTELVITIAVTSLLTFFGVIFAFELERWREGNARMERLVGALQMIRDEIERNVALCKQIENELSQHGPALVQFYNLKTTTWESVASALVDLKSSELAKLISTEYYEYEHLKRRIDARFEFFKTGDQSNVLQSKAFEKITRSVMMGVKNLQISGKNVLDAIDKQLDELKS